MVRERAFADLLRGALDTALGPASVSGDPILTIPLSVISEKMIQPGRGARDLRFALQARGIGR